MNENTLCSGSNEISLCLQQPFALISIVFAHLSLLHSIQHHQIRET
jgi:hypothetical protein